MASPDKSYPGQRLSVALVHWPVLDRSGKVVVTNVTNFDIHDIARVCRTYGVEKYYIVNRLREQLMFVSRVLDHWRVGLGRKLNPMRRTALDRVVPVESLEELLSGCTGERPLVVATAARDFDSSRIIKFSELKSMIEDEPERPILVVFGTGFGLSEEVLSQCDYLLEPIRSQAPDDYRHLSVRSAVSICLDRLLSRW